MGRELGNRLFELRKRNHLTQDEAADKCMLVCNKNSYPDSAYISRSALANYEKGIRTPDYLKIQVLADVYGVRVEELVMYAGYDAAIENNSTSEDRPRKSEQELYIQFQDRIFKLQEEQKKISDSIASAGLDQKEYIDSIVKYTVEFQKEFIKSVQKLLIPYIQNQKEVQMQSEHIFTQFLEYLSHENIEKVANSTADQENVVRSVVEGVTELQREFKANIESLRPDLTNMQRDIEKSTKDLLALLQKKLIDNYEENIQLAKEKKDDSSEPVLLLQNVDKGVIIDNRKAEELVLCYSSREELVLLEKIKRLNSENRRKIEDRIDMVLDMQ